MRELVEKGVFVRLGKARKGIAYKLTNLTNDCLVE